MLPSPANINRIPTFLLQNPAARAGPRLTYTKPETVRRDGSNEVAWAFNESLLALLFTHHRFLLNRSIAAGRARARPIRKFALLARVVSLLLKRFSGANPPRILCAYCCSVPGLGIGHRAPADQAQPCAYAPPAATPAAPWPPQAPAGEDHGGRVGLQHPIGANHLGMPTGARGPRGPESTVLSCPISLLGLEDANSGR